jgi:stearoyl-CoA desaturase (delta-9 desaturase)
VPQAIETDDLPDTATRGGETQGWAERIALTLFIVVPLLAVVAAVPVAWGGFLSWVDVAIALPMYYLPLLGVTVGFHRLFTHKSFKPNRPTKIALAVLGSMAVEGPVVRWVADHRKHHKFSDRDGDPHSPWKYGDSVGALTKGLFHAHIGWMFDPEQTPQRQYAPDLMKDRDLVWISRNFWVFTVISLGLPLVLGGLFTWSWQGALSAFFWGSIVRVGLLHHFTWSVNSICHAIGNRPFVSRDKSANVWWLAIPTAGEAWHNLHHADPTCARHGVLRGQIDASARTIWALEKLGWVTDVRWPVRDRIEAKLVANQHASAA